MFFYMNVFHQFLHFDTRFVLNPEGGFLDFRGSSARLYSELRRLEERRARRGNGGKSVE